MSLPGHILSQVQHHLTLPFPSFHKSLNRSQWRPSGPQLGPGRGTHPGLLLVVWNGSECVWGVAAEAGLPAARLQGVLRGVGGLVTDTLCLPAAIILLCWKR